MNYIDMKYFLKGLILTAMLFLSVSCSERDGGTHMGVKKLDKKISQIDSVRVDVQQASGRGNFYMADSSIYFADTYYMSLFQYDAETGELLSRHWGKGQGPGELPSFLYAYPLEGKEGTFFLIDNAMRMYTYDNADFSPVDKGVIRFGWEKKGHDNLSSPSAYNVMEMTDFGINFASLNDSTIILPLSIVNRFQDGLNTTRYEKGHILGEVNLNDMKVKRVFGRFPAVYQEHPTPFFEFFSYALQQDTLYVSHATDSLIYVYKYPDTLLYTMGYEAPSVDRGYTVGYDVDFSAFQEDASHVGANIGLTYVDELGLLARTVLCSFSTGCVVLQLYDGADLVLEQPMPAFFRLLGYRDGWFYGTRIIPIETEDENMYFVFYRFKV